MRICKWFLCNRRFASLAELRDHVVQDHVRSAQPIPRKDVDHYRRIEEDIDRRLSLEESGTSYEGPHGFKRRRVDKDEPSLYVNPADTLPSPSSEGLEYPDSEDPDDDPIPWEPSSQARQHISLSHQPPPMRTPTPPPPLPTTSGAYSRDLLAVPPRRTFASLDSPGSSQGSFTPLRASPSIADQIASHREKAAARRERGRTAALELEARNSTSSQSSTESRELVETQLTATLDWEWQSEMQNRQPDSLELPRTQQSLELMQTQDSPELQRTQESLELSRTQDSSLLGISQGPDASQDASASQDVGASQDIGASQEPDASQNFGATQNTYAGELPWTQAQAASQTQTQTQTQTHSIGASPTQTQSSEPSRDQQITQSAGPSGSLRGEQIVSPMAQVGSPMARIASPMQVVSPIEQTTTPIEENVQYDFVNAGQSWYTMLPRRRRVSKRHSLDKSRSASSSQEDRGTSQKEERAPSFKEEIVPPNKGKDGAPSSDGKDGVPSGKGKERAQPPFLKEAGPSSSKDVKASSSKEGNASRPKEAGASSSQEVKASMSMENRASFSKQDGAQPQEGKTSAAIPGSAAVPGSSRQGAAFLQASAPSRPVPEEMPRRPSPLRKQAASPTPSSSTLRSQTSTLRTQATPLQSQLTPSRPQPTPPRIREESDASRESLPPLPSSDDEDEMPPPLPPPPARRKAVSPARKATPSRLHIASSSGRNAVSPSRDVASPSRRAPPPDISPPPPHRPAMLRAPDNKFVSGSISIRPTPDDAARVYELVDDDEDAEGSIDGEDEDRYGDQDKYTDNERYRRNGYDKMDEDDGRYEDGYSDDEGHEDGSGEDDYIDVDALDDLTYPSSYPPLQTQAPYDSQAYSQ